MKIKDSVLYETICCQNKNHRFYISQNLSFNIFYSSFRKLVSFLCSIYFRYLFRFGLRLNWRVRKEGFMGLAPPSYIFGIHRIAIASITTNRKREKYANFTGTPYFPCYCFCILPFRLFKCVRSRIPRYVLNDFTRKCWMCNLLTGNLRKTLVRLKIDDVYSSSGLIVSILNVEN